MVSHCVDAEEYERGIEIVEDFTNDLSSEGASELATALKQ